ncbi:TetR/AcrR family transcriptional regulator [Gallaecimonas kandeliae]|uniref:TetR/AcrR family transcriptional regulator n=1 Tax=Gallaecimonas kandeliae TaxID=3029055 RepID=UPI00264904B5|nr:TetR/AcrR family transcriptional regulator [Gallaecimonas kandeliae]WKE65817.1 TetR/AcrR family transcriptional regulator [Gallaecimonas kandeliae]
MKTRDKILKASLALFNEKGERNVTTNHIAAHLGISPGNLYYHFRNKEDIVHAIFGEYVRHLETAFTPRENGPTLDALMSYMDGVFYTMWEFRFFYASLPDILARNPALHQEYFQVQTQLADRVVAIFRSLKEEGILNIDEESLPDLAHTVKIMVTFWISYQTTQAIEAAITRPVIYQGVLKVLFLIRPYLAPEAKDTIARLEDHYRRLATRTR